MTRVALKVNLSAERGKDLAHELDVAEVGHAPDDARFGGEQCGCHDGQHGVFGSADRDFTVQRHAAFD